MIWSLIHVGRSENFGMLPRLYMKQKIELKKPLRDLLYLDLPFKKIWYGRGTMESTCDFKTNSAVKQQLTWDMGGSKNL